MIEERDPPHNDEAEAALLGAILLDKRLPVEIAAKVEEVDFYRPAHRTVWRAINTLADADDLITLVTLFDRLRATGELADLGGASFIHDLQAAAATTAEAAYYAEIVAKASKLRQLIDAGRMITQLGYDARDASSAIADAEQLLSRVTATGGGASAAHAASLIPGGSFILDGPKGVAAVWGDGEQVAWSEGEPFLLVGPQGVGKTTLAGQLVLARLGLRPTVLGMPVQPGSHRVLYLACDRPAQVKRSFERMVTEVDRTTLDARLDFRKGPPPADFAKHPRTLLDLCRAADADTVVVDSLKDVALELSKDDAGAGLNSAFQHAIAAGVEVLGLHHQRKNSAGGGKPTSLADVYGSTWITAGCGSVILLWGDAGDPLVELTHLKQPAEPLGPLQVSHDHQTGTSTVAESVDLVELARRNPHGLTAGSVAGVLFDGEAPSKVQLAKARRKLDALVRRGLLHRQDGGRDDQGRQESVRYYAVTHIREAAS
jgi:replicative DNA helicase